MENHHFSWENPLFLWPFSIAFCMFTRGYLWFSWPLGWLCCQRVAVHLACGLALGFAAAALATPQKAGKQMKTQSKYLIIHSHTYLSIYIYINKLYIYIVFLWFLKKQIEQIEKSGVLQSSGRGSSWRCHLSWWLLSTWVTWRRSRSDIHHGVLSYGTMS